ncbi:MAG: hypothetical protein ABR910_09300 [Acidobacteriaceae bacterium]|jgi:hypothetical protein
MRPLSHWLLFVAASAAALVAVFGLPFLFPPSHPVPSQAYVVGYNNHVAAVSLALVSLVVLLLSLRGRGEGVAVLRGESLVSWRWLAGALMLVAVWNGTLSWVVFAAHGYAVEDFYFLPQLEKYYYLHRHLYSQIEFAYGPLLFYPPVWVHWLLSPFHISLRASYYVAMVGQHLAGMAMLWFVVNRLPMQHGLRAAGFASLTLFSFTPLLGPNYALMRYVLPVFVFVLLSQIERLVAAALAALPAQMLIWLDSSELAIGFGVAVAAFCLYRAWRGRSALWLAPIAGVTTGAAIYLAIIDRNVLSSLVYNTRGWANRVPLPSLEVATLLAATAWLVPRLVARHVRRDSPQSGLLLGLYAMGLALLPASLGLADIVHITGNSLVLFLLSLVAAAEWKLPMRVGWAMAVAATYLLMITRSGLEAHFRFYPDVACIEDGVTPLASRLPSRPGSWLRAFERRWPCGVQSLDVAALRAAIGDAAFAAPYPMPEIVEESLPQLPNFVPSYWSGTIVLWDAETEQRKADELRQVQWALLPGRPEPTPVSPNVGARFSLPTHYRALHAMTWDGVLAEEIDRNWTPAGEIGSYVLYRRVR